MVTVRCCKLTMTVRSIGLALLLVDDDRSSARSLAAAREAVERCERRCEWLLLMLCCGSVAVDSVDRKQV
jgi:hypothetical protein